MYDNKRKFSTMAYRNYEKLSHLLHVKLKFFTQALIMHHLVHGSVTKIRLQFYKKT